MTLADGRVIASVAVHAPAARMPIVAALRHVTTLRNAAGALAATLDDTAPRPRRKPARAAEPQRIRR